MTHTHVCDWDQVRYPAIIHMLLRLVCLRSDFLINTTSQNVFDGLFPNFAGTLSVLLELIKF